MIAIANFIGGGTFLIIGLYLLLAEDASWMIAGYNTMSAAEQFKWNERAMRRFIGVVLICTAVMLIIAGALALLKFYPTPVITVSWCIVGAAIIYCLIYLNKSPKFRA